MFVCAHVHTHTHTQMHTQMHMQTCTHTRAHPHTPQSHLNGMGLEAPVSALRSSVKVQEGLAGTIDSSSTCDALTVLELVVPRIEQGGY